MADLHRLYQAVLDGDAKTAVAVTQEAIAEKIDPLELISGTMVPAMNEVGKRYEEEEYFVPELLLSARAMKGSLELLRPLLAARGAQPAGRVAIGTVQGDLHDIGKNLVASLLEGGGFEVHRSGHGRVAEEVHRRHRAEGRRRRGAVGLADRHDVVDEEDDRRAARRRRA